MKPRTLMPLFTLLGALFIFASAFAAPGRTTYQARIVKPDGLPLEASNVSFRFTILDPSASCALYVEDYTAVNMAGGAGLISFTLGLGTRTFPVSGTSSTFSNTFDNSIATFNCQTTGTYSPVSDDNRKIVMQFNDGNGWQTLPAMAINAVPYAMYAGKSDNSIKLNNKSDSAFVEYSTLTALSCAADQAIKFNGVSFSCITVTGGGGGVSSVTTSGTVLSTGGTASAPVISIAAASFTQGGYLTSLDYTEFKAKLSASATQITNTLGFAPVSAAAVTTQINSSSLSGDVSGTLSSNGVVSVGGKTAAQISTSVNDTQAATASATADTIVKRNSSGNATFNDVYANAAKINYVDIYKPSTSFNIRLQAPTSLSSNYILNLPTTSGTTGQVLSTDGAGTLSWVNPSTGSVVSVSATAPLISTGGSTPTISITQATSSAAGYLSSTDWNTFNNKQAATSAAIIATLGYTPANSANSIDLGSASATGIIADARLQTQSNVTSGTQYTKVTVDGKGRVTSGAQLSSSDVTTALGYTPANDTASGTYLVKASNLSDLTNVATARTNLGLGTLATASTIDLGSASATGTLAIARIPSFTGDATVTAASNTIIFSNSGVTAGSYTKVTVDSKGRVTSSSALVSSDVTTALGYTPASASAATQWTTSGTDVYYNTGNVGIGTTNPNISGTSNFPVLSLKGISNKGSLLELYGTDVPIGSNVHGVVRVGNIVSGAINTTGQFGIFGGSSNSDEGQFLLYTKPTGSAMAERLRVTQDGNVGIGTTIPAAKLHLAAGTSSTAPLKLTSGTLLSSPQSGTMEYDGTNFYLTDSTNTRRTIATGSSAGTIDNASNINSSGNITMTPVGSVIVSSTTASTNSNTGALVVKGGLGVAGNINTAGNLNVSGSQVVDGSLKLSSMTSGSVLFAGASGTVTQDNSSLYWDGASKRLGIGSNSPAQTFSVSGTSYFSDNVGIGTSAPTAKLNVAGGDFMLDAGNKLIVNGTAGGNNYLWSPNVANPRLGIFAGGSEKISVNYSDGNVGIGTTTPSRLLDVKGIMAFEAPNSTNEWLTYTHTDNTYRLNYNGVGNDEVVIDSSGNVGIGTTSPAGKLDVSTAGFITAASNSSSLQVSTAISAQQLKLGIYDAASSLIQATYNNGQNQNNLLLNPFGGNVGIGTAGPGSILHLKGTGSTYLTIDSSDANTSDRGIRFLNQAGSAAGYITLVPNTVGTDSKMHFYVGGGTGSDIKTTILNNGNVGIGTTTPSAKLHVEQAAGGSGVRLSSEDATAVSTTKTSPSIRFDSKYWNGTASTAEGMDIRLQRTTASAGGQRLDILDNAGTTIMAVQNNGNVGIGTSAPTHKLHVQAAVNSDNVAKFVNTGTTPHGIMIDTSAGGGNAYTISAYTNTGTGFFLQNDGYVGIGTGSPATTLDVSGSVRARPVSVASSTTSVNWSSGNIQYTPDSCQAYTFNNIADGAAYTFVVKGGTSATCSFTLYSGNGSGALTGHYTPALAATTASTHTVFTFFRAGTDVYVSWTSGL